LASFDLSLAALADPDTRIAFETNVKLWDEIARRSNSPGFGVEAALGLPAGHFDLHEYLIRCSPTFGSGLRRMCRYVQLLSSRGHLEVEVTNEELRIVNRPPAVSSRHMQDFAMLSVVMISRRATGHALPLSRLGLMAAEPEVTKPLKDAFNCPIEFGAPANMIVFPRKFEGLTLPAHDERLLTLIERHAKTMIAALGDDQAPLRDRVRRTLFQLVQREEMSLDHVARAMGMSGRTLQRDLRDSGTSFRELVDEVRREIAISHMTQGNLPITAIALLLDFSDVSAFHRSFRRWTGQAPSVFRATMRTQ
jgi:AraC-like DNA-binding protein